MSYGSDEFRRRRIERDITDLRTTGGDPEVLVKTFTQGYCYELAAMLKRWNPEGEIMFDPEEQHYVFKFLGSYWDIRGELDLTDEQIDRLVQDNSQR